MPDNEFPLFPLGDGKSNAPATEPPGSVPPAVEKPPADLGPVEEISSGGVIEAAREAMRGRRYW